MPLPALRIYVSEGKGRPIRLLTIILISAVALVGLAAGRTPSTTYESTTIATTTVVKLEHYRGISARTWALRYRTAKHDARNARRVLLSRSSVAEAINVACATYGYCSTLWRKARCETGGTFDPHAHNQSGASGLYQFMPSTFASTPYARLSIWSPYASALAAGWMHEHGRGGEWTCQ